MLNAGWDEDLLRKELLRLKSMEFEIYSLGFNPKEKVTNTIGRHINHLE